MIRNSFGPPIVGEYDTSRRILTTEICVDCLINCSTRSSTSFFVFPIILLHLMTIFYQASGSIVKGYLKNTLRVENRLVPRKRTFKFSVIFSVFSRITIASLSASVFPKGIRLGSVSCCIHETIPRVSRMLSGSHQ